LGRFSLGATFEAKTVNCTKAWPEAATSQGDYGDEAEEDHDIDE
jgi:hypothetical protein